MNHLGCQCKSKDGYLDRVASLYDRFVDVPPDLVGAALV